MPKRIEMGRNRFLLVGEGVKKKGVSKKGGGVGPMRGLETFHVRSGQMRKEEKKGEEPT